MVDLTGRRIHSSAITIALLSFGVYCPMLNLKLTCDTTCLGAVLGLAVLWITAYARYILSGVAAEFTSAPEGVEIHSVAIQSVAAAFSEHT